MHTYDLFSRREYFEHLIHRFNTAKEGDVIVLATLEYEPGQAVIHDIVTAMCTAAQRGASVTFLVDAWSFMLKEGSMLGPVYFRKKDPKLGYGKFKEVIKSVHTLREHGVDCEVINKPQRGFRNPFAGRSHIKFALINNEVFVGGCNLSYPDQLDVMVRTENKKLSDYLVSFTADVIKHKNVRDAMKQHDTRFKIDNNTELLIDAGIKKQSIIYDQAFQLISEAKKKIYMTCQYFPNARTPAELAKASIRGVDVHLAYNHPDQHNSTMRVGQKRTIAYGKKRLPEVVFKNQLNMNREYLHAKILLSEKEVIVGSHNFVSLGVSLGTAEIALRSTSKEFIDKAQLWIKQL